MNKFYSVQSAYDTVFISRLSAHGSYSKVAEQIFNSHVADKDLTEHNAPKV